MSAIRSVADQMSTADDEGLSIELAPTSGYDCNVEDDRTPRRKLRHRASHTPYLTDAKDYS
jgi:hypothetical protein